MSTPVVNRRTSPFVNQRTSPFNVLARSCSYCLAILPTTPNQNRRLTRNADPERRAYILASMHSAQDETLASATRVRVEWTGPELEVLAREDLTNKEKAVYLGRTYYATCKMVARLKVEPKVQILAGLAVHHRPGLSKR